MPLALTLLLASAAVGAGPIATSSFGYVAQIVEQPAAKVAPAVPPAQKIMSGPLGVAICREVPVADRPARAADGKDYYRCERPTPLTAEEFGIGKVQCISSPAARAGEVMICEGRAFRIPARAIGQDVLLPKPVRAYVEQRDGEARSISLDGDELSALGRDVVRSMESGLERLATCPAASGDGLRVWLSESGYVAAARVPVPAYFAPSDSENWSAQHPGIAVLQFSPATTRIDCDPAVVEDKRTEDGQREKERRRVVNDL